MAEKGNILVVDDDRDICEVLTDVLKLEDYSVVVAHDGLKALDAARKSKFDAVLLDIKMPGMNGVETLKELKKISPGTPIIMITAFAVEDMIRESIREGAFAALGKPIDFDRLFATIEAARGNGGLVLVVDDDETICDVIKSALEEKGYRVEVASDGEEAVERTWKNDFDVTILDMKLPAMNGFEAFLSIRSIRPKAFVILITGYPETMDGLVKDALEKGAYISLRKPFDMEKLLEVLKEIMRQRRGR